LITGEVHELSVIGEDSGWRRADNGDFGLSHGAVFRKGRFKLELPGQLVRGQIEKGGSKNQQIDEIGVFTQSEKTQ